MKKSFLTPLIFLLLAGTSFAADSAAKLRERVQASYLIAFGRSATNDEVAYWTKQNPKSVADLVNGHRQYLKQDANTHRALIKRSYIDALGRDPIEGEFKHWMGGNDPYTQLMKNHVGWLAGNPAEYEAVIKRSYQFIFKRKADAGELKYWRSQGTVSYAMLVAAHDTWRKSNPTAPAKTAGVSTVSANSTFLATAPVSPAIAAEARIAGGLVAAGAGNLVGNDGGSLVGNDGASLVAAGGGNLVAAGGGNLVAAGGGNLVAAGGGN
jgi:hypothetical protein